MQKDPKASAASRRQYLRRALTFTPKKKNAMPVSGSEPSDFRSYATPRGVIRNNCMAFAFGEHGASDFVKQQPGNKSGLKTDVSLANCRAIQSRIRRDYPDAYRPPSPSAPCRRGFAKVMAFLDPDDDFHFYRQGPTGFWEHKRGLTRPTKVDSCGKRIVDPTKACRDYGKYDYTNFCGTFCRQVSGKKKAKPKVPSPTKKGIHGKSPPTRRR